MTSITDRNIKKILKKKHIIRHLYKMSGVNVVI